MKGKKNANKNIRKPKSEQKSEIQKNAILLNYSIHLIYNS